MNANPVTGIALCQGLNVNKSLELSITNVYQKGNIYFKDREGQNKIERKNPKSLKSV